MSTRDIYEYLAEEYQTITLEQQAQAGADAQFFTYRGIDIAGYDISIYSDSAGASPLSEGLDYTLSFRYTFKSASEQEDTYAGVRIDNVTYQGVDLWLSMKVIGGYTKYTGGQYENVSADATITPMSF